MGIYSIFAFFKAGNPRKFPHEKYFVSPLFLP